MLCSNATGAQQKVWREVRGPVRKTLGKNKGIFIKDEFIA
jgi:hypothetical protein